MQTRILDYYPPIIQQIREIQQITKAEDIEFSKLRLKAERSLNNMFILTADAEGIARFEGMLGVFPDRRDSIEQRRARVLAKWFDIAPYNMELLIKKMEAICGKHNFDINVPEGDYEVRVRISIGTEYEYLLTEAQEMLEEFLPVNMYFYVEGATKRRQEEKVFTGATKCQYIKIMAAPEPTQYKIERCIQPGAGMGTLVYTKGAYEPEREDI